MSYEAKTRDELARRTLGAITARSRLTDTSEGSVIDTISQAFGSVAAGIEQRIEGVRDAFDLRNATGAELDERVGELPPYTISRFPAQRARGQVVVGRAFSDVASTLTIPAGATFARADTGVVYSSLSEVTIPVGIAFATLDVEASILGTAGNAPSFSITQIEDAPNEILSVTNPSAISTGAEEESDAALKRRALLYLQSLAKCQPAALEFAALSADLPLRLTLADLYEIPQQIGHSNLYIDDGSGLLAQQTTAGRQLEITAPLNGLSVYYHDAPAVEDVIPAKLINNQLVPLDPSQYTSIPERGVIYLEDGVVIQGDVLSVLPYDVYTGTIRTIQELIEGDPNNPESSGGYRAAGTRVRVLSPSISRVSLDLQIQVSAGIDLDEMISSATEEITALVSSLRVGAPLYAASIIDVVMDLEGVENIHIFNAGLNTRFEDRYPPNGAAIRLQTLTIRPIEA